MNNQSVGTIVIDSTKEKNNKLKARWKKIHEGANKVSQISSSGFIVSLLSPFDFDGPIIEIATAVVAGVSFVVKKVAESRLSALNGDKYEKLDSTDRQTIQTMATNIGHSVNRKR